MLTDISFLHERSRIFGYYWATQNFFSSALSLASSYEAAISWRWFYGVEVIAIAVGLIFVVFGAFETRYVRAPTAIDGQVVITDEFGVTRVYSDGEAREHLAEIERMTAESEAHTVQPTQKTYLELIRPWSPISKQPIRIVFMYYVHTIGAFSSPGIVFAVLLSSIVLGTTIAISLTYNTVLQQHYGWPARNIGLINIGGMVGGFLGMVYAGWPADKFAVWMAKRNNGVHKPEHRLLVLLPPAILGVASTLLYGFTANGNATWWGPCLGVAALQVTFTVVLIVTTSFAAEVWPKNPGPAITVVVGAKNIISFAASYGLTPMVEKHGYAWACGVLAGIMGAIFLLTIPVYYFNPLWRKRIS